MGCAAPFGPRPFRRVATPDVNLSVDNKHLVFSHLARGCTITWSRRAAKRRPDRNGARSSGLRKIRSVGTTPPRPRDQPRTAGNIGGEDPARRRVADMATPGSVFAPRLTQIHRRSPTLLVQRP